MIDPEVLRREILEEIAEVFDHRSLPTTCTDRPLGGYMDELSAKRTIEKKILGKHWTKIDPEALRFASFFMSNEAICYYLPAILTDSLIRGEEYWWLPLQCDDTGGFCSSDALRASLTIPERLVIARYISFFVEYIGYYTEMDYTFWRHSQDT